MKNKDKKTDLIGVISKMWNPNIEPQWESTESIEININNEKYAEESKVWKEALKAVDILTAELENSTNNVKDKEKRSEYKKAKTTRNIVNSKEPREQGGIERE